MKLSKENIQFIDNYLIKLKIKYVDVRLELIDHLASDFEASNKEEQLVDYLKSKIDFIKDFEKKRQKTIHWSYQREMWRRLAMFFYKPNYLPFTIVFGFAVYWIQQLQPNKAFTLILIVSLSIIHFWALITGFSHYKTFKKLQMAQPLYSIMALPSLFLYTVGAATPWLEKSLFFYCLLVSSTFIYHRWQAIELRNTKQ